MQAVSERGKEQWCRTLGHDENLQMQEVGGKVQEVEGRGDQRLETNV